MKKFNIEYEKWREYQFNNCTYRIDNPKFLFLQKNSKYHRIVDIKGVVHCLPSPGTGNCVLRWESKDKNKPVAF